MGGVGGMRGGFGWGGFGWGGLGGGAVMGGCPKQGGCF